MNDSVSRTRTITWQDPLISANAAHSMSGLDYLQAVQAGTLPAPPMLHLLGMSIDSVAEGHVVFSVTPAEYHYNTIGVVHGGLAMTLCDSAMGCAVHSMLAAGVMYTTLELKTNFLRPLTSSTGTIRCEGHIIHIGRRTAIAEARVTDRAGKLYAHATTTCLIMRSTDAP